MNRALVALGLVALALLVAVLGYGLAHGERLFLGVRAAGIEVGGLTLAQAAQRLAERLPDPSAPVTLRDPADGRTWTFAASELGLAPSPDALAEAAARIGREGGLLARLGARFGALVGSADVPASAGADPDRARAALETLGPEVDVAPENADVRLEDGTVVERTSQTGRQLDLDATLARLVEAAGRGPTTVDVVTSGTAPRLDELGGVARAYRAIASGPVSVVWRDGWRHEVTEDQLAAWITLQPVVTAEGDAVPSIVVDRGAIRAWLEPKVAGLDVPAADARFRYDLATNTVSLRDPGRTGQRVNLEATVSRIVEGAYSTSPADRVAELAVDAEARAVSPDTLAELGDVLPLAGAATNVLGSPEARLTDLLVAADRLSGVAVPPAGEYSFNAALGPVTEEDGFDAAELEAVAGGLAGTADAVTQMATTVFRAAFWGGFPIRERHAPAVRIGFVEPPVGLDAAVGPGRDLVFVNDTGGYLLVLVELDARRGAVTWSILGRPRERIVEAIGPTVTGLRPVAPPQERRAPRLAAGVRRQVGWAREGADATVGRVVREGGAEVLADEFESHYRPAADLVLVGTGGGP